MEEKTTFGIHDKIEETQVDSKEKPKFYTSETQTRFGTSLDQDDING